METTDHLPPALLERIDRRAGQQVVRRNRYIVRALERAVDEESGSRTFLTPSATPPRMLTGNRPSPT